MAIVSPHSNDNSNSGCPTGSTDNGDNNGSSRSGTDQRHRLSFPIPRINRPVPVPVPNGVPTPVPNVTPVSAAVPPPPPAAPSAQQYPTLNANIAVHIPPPPPPHSIAAGFPVMPSTAPTYCPLEPLVRPQPSSSSRYNHYLPLLLPQQQQQHPHNPAVSQSFHQQPPIPAHPPQPQQLHAAAVAASQAKTTPSNAASAPAAPAPAVSSNPQPQPHTHPHHWHSLSHAYQTYLRHDKDEQAHFVDVCQSLRSYAAFALAQYANAQFRLAALPAAQRAVLPAALLCPTPSNHHHHHDQDQHSGSSTNNNHCSSTSTGTRTGISNTTSTTFRSAWEDRAHCFKEAAIRNQFCLDCILRHAGQPHSQQQHPTHLPPQPYLQSQPQQQSHPHPHPTTMNNSAASSSINNSSTITTTSSTTPPPFISNSPTPTSTSTATPTDANMSKVSSVLKSLMRDWSAEGAYERDMAYQPILQMIQHYVPIPTITTTTIPSQTSTSSRSNSPPQQKQKQNHKIQRLPPLPLPLPVLPPQPKLCVPGAGVGRLTLELAGLGYAVQGNEFSLHMLLASDFILNGGVATPATPLRISPFLLETRNVHGANDPMRVIAIPDVDPYTLLYQEEEEEEEDEDQDEEMEEEDDLLEEEEEEDDDDDDQDREAIATSRQQQTLNHSGSSSGSSSSTTSHPMSRRHRTIHSKSSSSTHCHRPPDLSMAAGEFTSVYGVPKEQGQWHGIVACFFLDSAPCIIEYLQVCFHMLAPGGVLLHLGPLLWHWSGPAMRLDDDDHPHHNSFDAYRDRYAHLDPKYLTSIDMNWEDIQAVLTNIGFHMLHTNTGVRAYYTADMRSMMNMEYQCVSFVAQKPLNHNHNPTVSSSSSDRSPIPIKQKV